MLERNIACHQVVSQHTAAKKSNARIYRSDFTRDSLSAILQAVKPDLAISTTAGRSFELQKAIIDAVVDTAIPCFIAAEFGDDVLNDLVVTRLPKLKQRVEAIQYLQKLSSADRLSWVAIATGCRLDQGLQSGRLGFDLKWHSATLHGSGNESFAASSTAWTGRVVTAVIDRWSDMRNQYIYACGLVTSANEVLNALERSTGKEWEAGRGEVGDCVREAERRIDRGFPDAGMFLMERSVLYDESLGAVGPFKDQDAKTKLGLSGEKLDDVVRAAVHRHSHAGDGGCGCD